MVATILATLVVVAVCAAILALVTRLWIRAPFGQGLVAWGLLVGVMTASAVLHLGIVGIVLAAVLFAVPTMVFFGFHKALANGPRPSSAAAMSAGVTGAVTALADRGLRPVLWTEQGRKPRIGTDATVVGAHLLSADGRTMCTVQGRRKGGRVAASCLSLIEPDRGLATMASVPFRAENRVSQRFTGLTPGGMLDRHLEALALCDAAGLRLTPLTDDDVAAVLDRNWQEMLELLRHHSLRLAYGIWFQLLLRRVPDRGPVADRPEALGRLHRWRDEQQGVVRS